MCRFVLLSCLFLGLPASFAGASEVAPGRVAELEGQLLLLPAG